MPTSTLLKDAAGLDIGAGDTTDVKDFQGAAAAFLDTGAGIGSMTLETAMAAVESQVRDCAGQAFTALSRAGLLTSEADPALLTQRAAGYAAQLVRQNWQGGG